MISKFGCKQKFVAIDFPLMKKCNIFTVENTIEPFQPVLIYPDPALYGRF